jgi:hypothetical protein
MIQQITGEGTCNFLEYNRNCLAYSLVLSLTGIEELP